MRGALLDAAAGRRAEAIGVRAYASLFGERAVRIGGATAFRAPEAPDTPMLNRVVQLGVERPATPEQLDAALLAMAGLRCYVAVSPAARPPELADWLRRRGFEPGWGWRQFRRAADDLPAAETALELVEVGPERADDFAHVVRAAYGLPEATRPWIAATASLDGWTCWLALADGEPAGAAALFVDDGAGYLGFAATLPEHRGKGAQSALLAVRIRRAAELGCGEVFTETGELRPDRPSNSYRNILRAGFEELHVVANWLSPALTPPTR